MIEEALGADYRSLRLSYAQEEEPLGTGGGIRLALDRVRGDVVLAMNGDSFCMADLAAYREWFFRAGSQASLLLTKVDDVSRYGQVAFDESGHVTEFAEKGAAEGPGFINAGIYLLKRSVLEGIPAGKGFSIERDVFPDLIGKRLDAYPVDAPFLDIGTPESYAEAAVFFKGM